VLEAALDAGVNLIDTGPDYTEGNAEKALGQVLKKRRQDAYVITKWHVQPDTPKPQMLASLDACLQRLQTDHVEFINVYAPNDVAALKNEALYEAFADAKQAGKAFFLGMSEHGGRMPEMMEYAISSNRFDLLVVKYNFMDFPREDQLLAAAGQKKIPVVAMKIRAGAQDEGFQEFQKEGVSMRQAAIKWALSNPDVSNVCAKMTTFDDVKEAVAAVGKPLTEAEEALLERYRQVFAHTYCRYCGACEHACPNGVAVAEVMRYAMYFRFYGLERDSMRRYARLPEDVRAAACAGCPGHCEQACPYQVKVQPQLAQAHELLLA
jgi:predicted aldo/keto reductase-like oxidoreductase